MPGRLYIHHRGLKTAAHFVLILCSFYLAFELRFNFSIPNDYLRLFTLTLPIMVFVKLCVFYYYGMQRASWRYVGARDLVTLFKASTISMVVSAIVIYTFFLREGFPRSIIIIDFFLTIVLVGGMRFSFRMVREMRTGKRGESKRIVVIGAGDAGEGLIREITRTKQNYDIISFFDDGPLKIGIEIYGIMVRGPVEKLTDFAKKEDIDEIFIAIPSAKRSRMREIIDLCNKTGCEVKIIPGLSQLIDGRVTVNQLRHVDIEDLLGRDPVELDTDAISMYLKDKTVMVTGAAGSIGSEICRQVLRFDLKKLILFDQAETGLFEINNELINLNYKSEIIPVVGDVCDLSRVDYAIKGHRPEVIFHAAAYKHVPMMENNPTEAVKNNVFGTKVVADLAREYGVRRFVFISTDKAVNPTSVMGATKRVAELYLRSFNGNSATKFMMVRFGNVLDSAGSVIPTFRRQIAAGGPVTVTHPEMTRYFMTIPEATQLVLQAAAMGSGGEIFVLDMGEPVKILDLARDMIRLSGLIPEEDIQIVFTGVRQGEKLYEELWHQVNIAPTKHNKIFIKSVTAPTLSDFKQLYESLLLSESNENAESIKRKLSEMVPEYQGCGMKV